MVKRGRVSSTTSKELDVQFASRETYCVRESANYISGINGHPNEWEAMAGRRAYLVPPKIELQSQA